MKTTSQKKLLIANRGEIACRILRAGKERGYHVAVIATEDDLNSLVCQKADHVIVVSGFLNAKEIVEKATHWQADLIHPGYGFLSENSAFAEQVEEASITFVGPSSDNMKAMGSKESAKRVAQICGVPTLDALFSQDLEKIPVSQWQQELVKKGIHAPYLVKASGGGGGRGMRIVETFSELKNAIERASEESLSAFGDKTVFVERYLKKPRHIEIQVFGDGKGGGVFLGERECSLQRRHQKVIEEAPSSAVSAQLRQTMGKASLDLVKHTQYRGAGTVEFLLDEQKNFYFLEMNTRLQVEHPVTELVYGVDLVHAQFDLAEGHWPQKLPDPTAFCLLEPSAVALEARILAEDPRHQFLPTPGKISVYQEPQGPGVRVDSGVVSGSSINSNFDSMIAKLIVHAPSRELAVERLQKALCEFVILGCTTNLSFLQSISKHHDFLKGNESTSWIGDHLDALNQSHLDDLILKSLCHKSFAEKLSFAMLDVGIPQGVNRVFSQLGKDFFDITPTRNHHEYRFSSNRLNFNFKAVKAFKNLFLYIPNQNQTAGEYVTLSDPMYERQQGAKGKSEKREVHAPMAGKVFDIFIKPDDSIEENQILFIIESMKMQLEIRAHSAGKIKEIFVTKGQILNGPELMAVLQ